MGANLYNTNLNGADLRWAFLRDANLQGADLREADLYKTDISGANLYGANLYGAKNVPFIPYSCPDTGAFIGYKKARGEYIVKLEILPDAERCSATTRKCRCDKAKVLQILNTDRSEADIKSVASRYDIDFIYTVGEIVKVDNFEKDRWKECAPGIHFFINFDEAAKW